MSGTRMKEFDEEPVDINTAGELKSKDAITNLRHELQLTPDEDAVTKHFYHDNGLADDLLPLVDDCIPSYKRMIEEHVHATNWEDNNELAPYIAKEKSALLNAMKAYKCAKIKKLVDANDIEYSLQCSAAQPNQYIQLTNTYFYVKKNIIIALYNAARDYYKIILKNYENKPAELDIKIAHFNIKFQSIAHIDSELALSSIDNALQNLCHLPLVRKDGVATFESAIDALIKRCARTSNVLGQYGDAFRCVQRRLNALNDKEYIDPITGAKISKSLFIPIAAPGEDTKGWLLLNIPLATTTANLSSTLKGAIVGDAEHFVFSDITRKLDDKINQSKIEFHTQLKHFLKYIEDMKNIAKQQLESDDVEFNYDPTCDNIHAYADLLREQVNIHGRIESHVRLINNHRKQLAPKISARTEFHRLASDHTLDITVDKLEACVFAADSDAKLVVIEEDFLSELSLLAEQKTAIDILVRSSYDKSSMLIGDTFFYQHTDPLKIIFKKIQEITDSTNSVIARLGKLNEEQHNATRLIEAFETFRACQDNIERYTLKYSNQNLTLPRAQNATNDVLLPAIAFYREASTAYQALEIDIKNQQATLLATRTHYIKSVTKEKLGTLTACIDQLIKQSNQQLQEAKQFVTESQGDTNLLLLCHLYVNAMLNFPHWQSVKKFTDTTRAIQAGTLTYYLPAAIVELIEILKRNDFAGWENNPAQAKNLLEALHVYAKNNSFNANVEGFLAHLRTPKNIEAISDTEALYTTQLELRKFCSSASSSLEHSLIRPIRLTRITPTLTFWEKHPILKKGLIGLAIGAGALILVATIIGVIIATQGVAAAVVLGAFQTLAFAVGSSAAAAAIMAAATAGMLGIAMAIGALIGVAQYSPQAEQVAPLKAVAGQAAYHSSSARILSDMEFDSYNDAEKRNSFDCKARDTEEAAEEVLDYSSHDTDNAFEAESASPYRSP